MLNKSVLGYRQGLAKKRIFALGREGIFAHVNIILKNNILCRN